MPEPGRMHDNHIKVVKKLLKTGKSKTYIARSLGISRYQMDKLMEQLIISNKKTKTRISKLQMHDDQIRRWLKNGISISEIRNLLSERNIKVHISTVTKYTKYIRIPEIELEKEYLPGEIAFITILPIRQSKGSYLFCLLLGHSYYCYFGLLTQFCVYQLLKCFTDCFTLLNGIPHALKFCDISSFHLTRKDRDKFQSFLSKYEVKINTEVLNDEKKGICKDHSEKIKNEILSTYFDKTVLRLSKYLKTKYINAFNLSLHPITQRPIYKEFKQKEQHKLMPLPKNGFPKINLINRKVSIRGTICYDNKHYKLPKYLKGQTIQIIAEGNNVIFKVNEKLISKNNFPQ